MMDLIWVQVETFIILREHTLLFTLLCFSYFVLSRHDCIDTDLVFNSQLIKLISELQME